MNESTSTSISVLVVGASEPVAALAAALQDNGIESSAHRAGRPGGSDSRSLARALVELEPLVRDGVTAVVAVGSGDAATAAALVAGKAGVALYSVIAAVEADGDESRAVGQLSAEQFEMPTDSAAIDVTAKAIALAVSGG